MNQSLEKPELISFWMKIIFENLFLKESKIGIIRKIINDNYFKI